MIKIENSINNYCNEIANEFVEQYLKQLDKNIYLMCNHFGYEGDLDNLSEWLKEKKYNILMDEEKNEGSSDKLIYLVNEFDFIMALFMVKIFGEDDLQYSISDVFIRQGEE